MASSVSALSSIAANGHQVVPTFPPHTLLIPYGGFPPVRLEASLIILRPSATGPGCVGCRTCGPFRFWLSVQAPRTTAVPTGPWRSTVYHLRACKRYYGLIRQSDELRPAWASSAYSVRSLPSQAARLTLGEIDLRFHQVGWLGIDRFGLLAFGPFLLTGVFLQESPRALMDKLAQESGSTAG